MGTTVDIADPVLEELKRLRDCGDESMGALISRLLARALKEEKVLRESTAGHAFRWNAGDLGAKVALDDKEAMRRVLEDGDRT